MYPPDWFSNVKTVQIGSEIWIKPMPVSDYMQTMLIVGRLERGKLGDYKKNRVSKKTEIDGT